MAEIQFRLFYFLNKRYNSRMTYQELLQYLFDNCDSNFALFQKSLSKSTYISIGVKTPVLRKLIKEHYKDSNLKLEEFEHHKYQEVDVLYFGIGLSRCKDIDEQLDFLLKNLKYAGSWAITDLIGANLKKCSYEKFWEFFLKTNDDEYIYTRRFAYVFGLKFSSDKRILDTFKYFKPNEDYMVMMAEAWLLSFVAIHYPEEVYDYLFKCEDDTLKRKAISKISDSYRFSDETKAKFKSLR